MPVERRCRAFEVKLVPYQGVDICVSGVEVRVLSGEVELMAWRQLLGLVDSSCVASVDKSLSCGFSFES